MTQQCQCGPGWTINDTITISASLIALALSEVLGLMGKNSKYHSILHILADFAGGILGATLGKATAPLAIAAAAGAEAVHEHDERCVANSYLEYSSA